MKYVMVLLVPFYRVDNNTIACESAFAEHLKKLLPRISEWGTEIVIHSPSMSQETYDASKHHLAHIDSSQENIYYADGFPVDTSRLAFFLKAPFTIWPAIWKVVKTANVVHASASKDPMKLFTIMSLIFAALQGKKSILVMDIDHRNSAKMSYKTGHFSRKSYWLSQYLYNPIVSLQLYFAVKYCHLLMLKGQALVEDYGRGKAHVKNFYDTAHDASFILSDAALEKKLSAIDENKTHIKLVYFGRIVGYKGIADMIEATAQAAAQLVNTNKKVSLSIIGSGDIEAELQALVKDKQLSEIVRFIAPLSYGKELFDELKKYDLLLAAPRSEDTPRSVFDAMACGLPIVAYDTYYYKDLETIGTVKTVPWLSTHAMADMIIALLDDSEQLKVMVKNSREFAINNTQDIWLNKRLEWTKEFLG
jgi:glycosyltransferase involved in cell wall biosynthesis